MTPAKAWAFYDAATHNGGGCQRCGDDDEFSPVAEAWEDTGEIMCGDCWEAHCEAEIAADEEADDFRRANPIEPGFRRLDR